MNHEPEYRIVRHLSRDSAEDFFTLNLIWPEFGHVTIEQPPTGGFYGTSFREIVDDMIAKQALPIYLEAQHKPVVVAHGDKFVLERFEK